MINKLYILFGFRNDHTNKSYSALLNKCMDSGINIFHWEDSAAFQIPYYGFVLFNNGVTYAFWNANKYYAWLNRGYFSNENEKIDFKDMMPDRTTTVRFYDLIKKYNHKKTSPDLFKIFNDKI